MKGCFNWFLVIVAVVAAIHWRANFMMVLLIAGGILAVFFLLGVYKGLTEEFDPSNLPTDGPADDYYNSLCQDLERMKENGASERECERFRNEKIALFEPLAQYWNEIRQRWETGVRPTASSRSFRMLNPKRQRWDSEFAMWVDIPTDGTQMMNVLKLREKIIKAAYENALAAEREAALRMSEIDEQYRAEEKKYAELTAKLEENRRQIIAKRRELQAEGTWNEAEAESPYIGVGFGADYGMFGKN